MAVMGILSLLAWWLNHCCLYWTLCLLAEFPVYYTWILHSSVMKMNFLSPSWVLVMPNASFICCLLVLFHTAPLQYISAWLHHYSILWQQSCLTLRCNFNIAWLTVKLQKGMLLGSRICIQFSSPKCIQKRIPSTFLSVWLLYICFEPFSLHLEMLCWVAFQVFITWCATSM